MKRKLLSAARSARVGYCTLARRWYYRWSAKKQIVNHYHIRDAREILSVITAKSFIDATITSPPYWNLKDYGSPKQIGFGQRYEDYLDDLERIFKSVYRVTKKTGSLWVIADTIKEDGELKLFPFDLAERLKRVGWILHDIIVWHKDKTLPWSHRGKLRNIFEYVLFFSKSQNFKYYLSKVRETENLKAWWKRYPERYSPQGKAPTRTWSIPIPRQGSWGENWVRHFCPLPPDLVRRVVLLSSRKGDVILDPFAGSGVVLAQAKALKRRYVGFDLSQRYRKMFQQKVLPSIMALENGKIKNQDGAEKKRRNFSSVIWNLRKTKYPRELLRLLEKKYGKTSVTGILASSRQRHSLHIIFLFHAGLKPRKKLADELRVLMGQPPLSKYGLKVTVKWRALTENSALRGRQPELRGNGNWSLYKDGKTYVAGDKVSLGAFLKGLSNGLGRSGVGEPILASNIRVRVPG